MKVRTTSTTGFVIVLGIFLAMAVGWVMNVVAIATSGFDPITGMLVLRCIGVFIAPLGAVLGYL